MSAVIETIQNAYNWPKRWYNEHSMFQRLSKMHKEADAAEVREDEDVRRTIAADLLEVYSTHLVLNKVTFIRCIVGGLTDADVDGLPPYLTEDMHDNIMDLERVDASIDISTGLIKIPRLRVYEDLDETHRDNTVDLNNELKHNGGNTLKTKRLQNERKDIEAIVDDLHDNSKHVYDATYIITVMGDKKAVEEVESNVLIELKSNLMETHLPFDKMAEAFIASRLFPKSDKRFQIRIDSDSAALLCATVTQNAPVDEEGFLFGVEINTGEDIIINEKMMAARHRKYFGATGAGKSFTASDHLYRAMTFYGCRGCVITPKREAENFAALAKKHGKKGKVVRLGNGAGNSGLQILQIFVDHQTMGDSPDAYEKAYNRYVKTLINGFDHLFTSGLSDFAKGYLEGAIHTVYSDSGLVKTEPSTWKDIKWPKIQKLWEKCDKDSRDQSLTTQTRTEAGTLALKLRSFAPGGTNSFLSGDAEEIDYSELDLIVFDISGVDEDLQDFMYIIITGILGNRFTYDLERDTIIVIDEARVFLRNPHLNIFMKDGVALGRSYGVWFWLITQNPKDFAIADADSEMDLNIPISIMMANDIDDSNIEPIMEYFHLTREEAEQLIGCDQGEGYLRVKNNLYLVRFETSEEEYLTLKNLEAGEAIIPTIKTNAVKIKPEFKDMVDHHHIILKEMVDGDPNRLKDDGWVKKSHLPTIKGSGSRTIWHRPGEIEGKLVKFMQGPIDSENTDGPEIGKMTVEHLLGVVESELFARLGGLKTESSHNNGADLTIWVKGEPHALEWTLARSATVEGLQKKLGKLLANYKSFRFGCSAEVAEYEKIAGIVGAQYVAPRGDGIMSWLNELIRINNTPEVTNIPWVMPKQEVTETSGTSPDDPFDVNNLPDYVLKRNPDFVWKEIYPSLSRDKKEALVNDIINKTNTGYYHDTGKTEGKSKKAAGEHKENVDIENAIFLDVPEEIGAT